MPNRSILVVDDDPAILDLIQLVLSELDVPIVVASDAESGVQRLRAERPSVALVDVQLPGLSGFEMLDEIRDDAANQRTQVIAMSARNGELRDQALEAGFADFLGKPFDVDTLVDMVRRHLR